MAVGLTVCISTYNYARYLSSCVRSVLKCGVADLEILIMDDCSTDETSAVAANLVGESSLVRYVRHQRNIGHINNYNEGIRSATKPFFMLISADDMLVSRNLAPRLEYLLRNPHTVLSFAAMREFYSDGSRSAIISPIETTKALCFSGEEFLRRSFQTRRCLALQPCVIARTETLRSVGGYKQNHPVAGDLELWLRLACHGNVAYHPEVAALYRRHSASMSSASPLQERMHAHRAFKDAVPYILARYPELRSVWMGTQRGWVRDLSVAAGSALEQGDSGTASDLAAYTRSLNAGLQSVGWQLRLRLRLLLGENRWKKLRGGHKA